MNHDKLMKRLEKKGKKLQPLEQKAKLDVVKELSSQAGEALGDKLKGLKKVTVAADSKEGLKEGLEKAEEIVEKQDPMEKMKDMLGSKEQLEESEEQGEEDDMLAECQDMSADEIQSKIEELMALKKQKEQQA